MIQHKIQIPSELLSSIFGTYDSNIRKIEDEYKVSIVNRGDDVVISGEEGGVLKAKTVVNALINLAKSGQIIEEQNVNYIVSETNDNNATQLNDINDDFICLTMNGRALRPKTLGQKKYVDSIRKNTIVFGVGPAGTGKTYLAMAMAITAFKNNEVNRIILTRPAIEAGENLGFLPGDLQQKVDPYLRPLYDALYEIMGAENFARNMEKGAIEVAPLAYMRGRTLDNSFIVLDEAQNTTPEQMKMFLTRIGFGSKVIVTGDSSQKDLPVGTVSGLDVAIKVLSKVDDIGFVKLTNQDVVRHPLVQKIVKAYEDYESRQNRRTKSLVKDKESENKKEKTTKRRGKQNDN